MDWLQVAAAAAHVLVDVDRRNAWRGATPRRWLGIDRQGHAHERPDRGIAGGGQGLERVHELAVEDDLVHGLASVGLYQRGDFGEGRGGWQLLAEQGAVLEHFDRHAHCHAAVAGCSPRTRGPGLQPVNKDRGGRVMGEPTRGGIGYPVRYLH